MLHACQKILTAWFNENEPKDYLGDAISTRQIFDDWRVCGIQSSIPSVRRLSEKSGLLSPDKSDPRMDESKLEIDCNGDSGIEHISFRRLRDAVGFAQKDSVHNRLRRVGIGLLAIWCITTSVMTVKTLLAVSAIHTMLNEVQDKVVAEQVRQEELK